MTFEEFLEATTLPSTAKMQLPLLLSDGIKHQLIKKQNSEEIIRKAIDEINSGSV